MKIQTEEISIIMKWTKRNYHAKKVVSICQLILENIALVLSPECYLNIPSSNNTINSKIETQRISHQILRKNSSDRWGTLYTSDEG